MNRNYLRKYVAIILSRVAFSQWDIGITPFTCTSDESRLFLEWSDEVYISLKYWDGVRVMIESNRGVKYSPKYRKMLKRAYNMLLKEGWACVSWFKIYENNYEAYHHIDELSRLTCRSLSGTSEDEIIAAAHRCHAENAARAARTGDLRSWKEKRESVIPF